MITTDDIKRDMMGSDTQYCYYCLTPKGDSFSCCRENHFGTFANLYPEDQQALLDEECANIIGDTQ